MRFHVGTDVGGTFTDVWVADDGGATSIFKTPTTPDVQSGVLDGVSMAAESYGLTLPQFCSAIERFGHGTTVGLNALLTGTAAKTGIVTTRGFRDTLEIGRLRRQSTGLNESEYTDSYLRNRHAPLVPRALIVEVDERIDVNGRVITPLDEPSVHAAVRQLAERGVGALAICTLFSTLNPAHENRIAEIVRASLPDVFVSLSHEVSPAVGEYARMSTTAANAALGPLAGGYLARLEARLKALGMTVPVLMMTCAGGVLPTAALSDRPVLALFSGPAGGVMGSQRLGHAMGLKAILSTDIGGTSFDVGVIADAAPVMRAELSVAGADLRVHSIDVQSIGAGGGSIAVVNAGGELTVGPQSAGAHPGPVCYGRGGTQPTATDADLVLGVLDPDNFIGGRIKLDLAAARHAIEQRVARPLGVSIEAAAWGIRQILDARMADLLRRVTVERGYDPKDFTLFANGGAGPSHAWALAAELGLDGFVAPAAATVLSALGTAVSDVSFNTERATYVRVQGSRPITAAEAAIVTAGLRSAGAEVATHLSRATTGALTIERFAAIRFRGQTHHLDIKLASDTFGEAEFAQLVAAFQQRYRALFGASAAYAKAGYEILSVRAVGTGVGEAGRGPALSSAGEEPRPGTARPVIFDDPERPALCAVHHATVPRAGWSASGPCIIEFPGQSVVVPPGASAVADQLGNLHVRFKA